MLTRKHLQRCRYPPQFVNEYAPCSALQYLVDDWCWEIPAGGIKDDLSPTEVALMELREEIGGTANRLEYFGQFYTAYGIANVVAHIFIANGVSLGQTAQEPAEVMEIHINPLAEVLRMARTNQISDGPSALALLLCAEKLEGLSIQ